VAVKKMASITMAMREHFMNWLLKKPAKAESTGIYISIYNFDLEGASTPLRTFEYGS
jgi:hypothetical protein